MSDSCFIPTDNIKKESSPLVPISKGEEQCAPLHTWGAGVRSLYIIHYIINGTGIFWCGTKKYNVTKGQIFLIAPNTIVKYQAGSENPWHYIWVCFYGSEAKYILSKAGIDAKNPVATVKNPLDTLNILRSMPNERNSNLKNNLQFSARLYDFLSSLIPDKTEKESCKNAYLTTATEYISNHFFEEITVDSVASHTGISRKYLFAIFKELLGISPKDYITNYRIERAKDFIRNSTLSIGSIAYSVGYNDPLAFSKMFRQKTGMSPTEYRNR